MVGAPDLLIFLSQNKSESVDQGRYPVDQYWHHARKPCRTILCKFPSRYRALCNDFPRYKEGARACLTFQQLSITFLLWYWLAAGASATKL